MLAVFYNPQNVPVRRIQQLPANLAERLSYQHERPGAHNSQI